MPSMLAFIWTWLRPEDGQGLVEYALIICLIALLLISFPFLIQGNLVDIFTRIGSGLHLLY